MAVTARILIFPAMLTVPLLLRRSQNRIRVEAFNGVKKTQERINSYIDAIAHTEDNLAILKRRLQDERHQLAALKTSIFYKNPLRATDETGQKS